MAESRAIFRKWTGRIRTNQGEEYVRYVMATGGGDFAKTPGNLGFQVLLRDLGDGTSEVSALSWWKSMDAIRAFAGADPEIARYYPDDDRFLVDRPKLVEHHIVVIADPELDSD
jgi:heme-degrading monooxygenase HmoA